MYFLSHASSISHSFHCSLWFDCEVPYSAVFFIFLSSPLRFPSCSQHSVRRHAESVFFYVGISLLLQINREVELTTIAVRNVDRASLNCGQCYNRCRCPLNELAL